MRTVGGDRDEIVICGDIDQFTESLRYRPPTLERISDVPRAQFRISDDVLVSADLEQANVGGFVSNRLMATLKIDF